MAFDIDNGKIFTDGTVLTAAHLNNGYTSIEDEFNGVSNTANPAWNQMVKIGSTSSDGTLTYLEVTGLTTTPYRAVKAIFSVRVNSNNGINLRINGSSSSYEANTLGFNGATITQTTDTQSLPVRPASGSNPTYVGGYVLIDNVLGLRRFFNGQGTAESTFNYLYSGSFNNTSSTVTAVQLTGSGTIISGAKLDIYGVK